jgi:hypothetical protein
MPFFDPPPPKRLRSGGREGREYPTTPVGSTRARPLDDDVDAVAVSGVGASLRPPRSHHGSLPRSAPNARLPLPSTLPPSFDADTSPPPQPIARPGTGGETTGLFILWLAAPSPSPRLPFPFPAFETPSSSSALGTLRVGAGTGGERVNINIYEKAKRKEKRLTCVCAREGQCPSLT